MWPKKLKEFLNISEYKAKQRGVKTFQTLRATALYLWHRKKKDELWSEKVKVATAARKETQT